MKYCAIVLCSVVLVAADVSHLFNSDPEHHYDQQEDNMHVHSGYNYPRPNVAFKLTKNEYLPPTVPPTPAATYLPPTSPTTEAPPPPPPAPTYLPPTEQPIFRIPIPSYAAPLEYDFLPEPTNEYLPPANHPVQAEPEPEQHGYHYNVPSIPFRF